MSRSACARRADRHLDRAAPLRAGAHPRGVVAHARLAVPHDPLAQRRVGDVELSARRRHTQHNAVAKCVLIIIGARRVIAQGISFD